MNTKYIILFTFKKPKVRIEGNINTDDIHDTSGEL